MMEEIKAWLSGVADYETGVFLYTRYGCNPQLKKLFREQWTSFKEDTLKEALKSLLSQVDNPVTETAKAQKTVKEAPFNQYKHWPSDSVQDPVLRALHNQWKPLYARMMFNIHRVRDVALQGEQDTNKAIEAGQLAISILELDDSIESIYAKRNFYYEHNRLPDEITPEDPEIVDPVRWAIELANNQRYVREYKIKLKNKPGHKTADKWAIMLKEKEALVRKYKKLLNID